MHSLLIWLPVGDLLLAVYSVPIARKANLACSKAAGHHLECLQQKFVHLSHLQLLGKYLSRPAPFCFLEFKDGQKLFDLEKVPLVNLEQDLLGEKK